ncbi:putative disease resistance protein At1g59780 [Triticum urartu]|uniref:putative disease resistance protein At1g59780 n=1 Tax=Triticum urartu TaxID=4572 RepID=UPI002043621A|nr:putative disease resistance protein At1g59780 [Triticum urartu]
MAEAIVGPLVSKLQELALSEGRALVAVSGEIGTLRDKLMWLLAFLQEADPRRRTRASELMRVLVRHTRDAAFSAEDAVDEYVFCVDLSRYPSWSRAILGFLAGSTTQLLVRHRLSGEIAAINGRLEEIIKNKEKYRLDDSAAVSSVRTWTASAASSSVSLTWSAFPCSVTCQVYLYHRSAYVLNYKSTPICHLFSLNLLNGAQEANEVD